MVYCVAFGCTNSSCKGHIMKIFPKDPDRRAAWEAKVRRQGWKATNASRICEKHFDESQWEKPRCDGKRKLRWDAVPTIFDFKKVASSEFKSSTKRKSIRKVLQSQMSSETLIDKETASMHREAAEELSAMIDILADKEKTIQALISENSKYKKRLALIEKQIRFLHIKVSTNRARKHRNNKRAQIFECNLKRVFNPDQLKALENASMRFRHWSHDTIVTALRLKLSCGSTGYRSLLKLHLPFPSIRTLQRRLLDAKV